MIYRLEIADSALDDAENFARGMSETSPERADRWARGLFETIQTLASFPFRCPVADESGRYPEILRECL